VLQFAKLQLKCYIRSVMDAKGTFPKIYLFTFLLFILSSCDPQTTQVDDKPTAENERIQAWFAQKFERDLADAPEWQTVLGRKDRQHELDDVSEKKKLEQLKWKKQDLEELMKFDTTLLNVQNKLSYELFKLKQEIAVNYEHFRHYNYPITHRGGIHSGFVAFMINMHQVKDLKDAEAYISRLGNLPEKMNQEIDNLKIRASKGIILPKFVFPHIFRVCNNIVSAERTIEENVLYKDFLKKLDGSGISDANKQGLLDQAKNVLNDKVIPAYQTLLTYMQELESKADTIDGVWRFENGDEYYQYRLKKMTTTSLSPESIFNTGIDEVERIQKEMKEIMKKVGFKGELKDFFKFVQKDDQFYFPSTNEGKSEMLDGYKAIIDTMKLRLDAYFHTKPKASIIVKAVEMFREKSAGKAFYQKPAMDGSRPGIFYANLSKMRNMPKYEMEALAYHEGIPGHHMQLSIAQEMENLPEFRKHYRNTAYIEGWGLYTELLSKEIGFYQDPYSDFGRLAMELWRACRLVVDVGIHYKRWSREQAIEYLDKNTPNTTTACTKAIERYIVKPGQATAYKIGMLIILEVRENAKKKLGDKFDIREFHDIFLLSGPVPLSIFEKRVNDWIRKKLAS